MPPPIGIPENVATSIQACATGGLTTCLGGVWALAAQALATAERVRHGCHPGGVDGLHLLDHREDVGQLLERALRFVVRDLDPGELGDAADLVEIECQGGRGGKKAARKSEPKRTVELQFAQSISLSSRLLFRLCAPLEKDAPVEARGR